MVLIWIHFRHDIGPARLRCSRPPPPNFSRVGLGAPDPFRLKLLETSPVPCEALNHHVSAESVELSSRPLSHEADKLCLHDVLKFLFLLSLPASLQQPPHPKPT